MPQVCLYPKDVAQLTGTGYDAGKRLLQRIRIQLRKPARAYVSVAEFCEYTRLPEAEVAAALNRGWRQDGGSLQAPERQAKDSPIHQLAEYIFP